MDTKANLLLSQSERNAEEGFYDYIIIGCGCAGLSLALHIIHSGWFSDKKILIMDKGEKNRNDRTWCYWEKEAGLFEDIVYRKWDRLSFANNAGLSQFSIAPYYYKMIRGEDYYKYCLDRIAIEKNFTIQYAAVERVFSDGQGTGIEVEGKKIYSRYVFNSAFFTKPELKNKQYWLLQHFKGIVIRVPQNVFDSSVALLMDFRALQKGGLSFSYVLPMAPNEALVEYTIFSKEILTDSEYDFALKNYISNILGIYQYDIVATELGAIPMTNVRFKSAYGSIINIGTAGGKTKGSTGYTFNFIHRHSKAIVSRLIKNKRPIIRTKPRRFSFYDGLMLHILALNPSKGVEIFGSLFKKNPPQKVLRFLDDQSNLLEEISIIRSLPFKPFLKAAIKQLF
ncbi:MAG: lycopene cyclase family protein [Flavisolibacter sp.]